MQSEELTIAESYRAKLGTQLRFKSEVEGQLIVEDDFALNACSVSSCELHYDTRKALELFNLDESQSALHFCV